MTIEIDRATNDALELNDTMRDQFGAPITVSEVVPLSGHDRIAAGLTGAVDQENKIHDRDGRHVSTAKYVAFSAALNISKLEPGLGYGLFRPDMGVVPAIISPRSITDRTDGMNELHVLFLTGEGIPPVKIGDPAYAPNTLQINILRGVNPYQGRESGSKAADNSASTASEGGHAMLALRSLTHEGVRDAVMGGRHIVHGLAESSKGIMPAFSSPDSGVPGMLSTPDRPIIPDEMIIRPGDKSALLIDHESYRAISTASSEISPDLLVAGLGIAAAKGQLGLDDITLRDRIMGIADKI